MNFDFINSLESKRAIAWCNSSIKYNVNLFNLKSELDYTDYENRSRHNIFSSNLITKNCKVATKNKFISILYDDFIRLAITY